MSTKVTGNVEEDVLLRNTLKTLGYLFEAIRDQDYVTANLELEELKITIKNLEDLKQKREKKQLLLDIVKNMQKRGIKIDIAKRSSFLKNSAKNAEENSLNNSKIHKKRQQA